MLHFATFFLGMDNFESLLEGAHFMDKHFTTAPMAENVSAILYNTLKQLFGTINV